MMSDLIEFLTSKEIVLIYFIAGLSCFVCIIVYMVEKNNDKRRRRHNTKELNKLVEVIVLDYDDKDIRYVDGYPLESLELQLKWMLEHNRDKDQEKIKKIKEFLNIEKVDSIIKVDFEGEKILYPKGVSADRDTT